MFIIPGRNEACWCGSEKKFKKCHLNREHEPPLERQDFEQQTKKHTKTCCAETLNDGFCTTKVIKAHTISKSGSLKQIAENGHVMGTRTSLNELIKTEGVLVTKKVGINDASTFTGFCSYHDKELFAALEDRKITLSNEQLFLLAYRSTSRELYAKEEQLLGIDFMKISDRGQPRQVQEIIQKEAKRQEVGIKLALDELNSIKNEMDTLLLSRRFDEMNHFVIELSDVPDILVSGSTQPEFDFSGARLQNLGLRGGKLSHLIYNAISYENKGCFVFSWLSMHNKICKRFIDSLTSLAPKDLSTALVKYCYTFCENTWASPVWWDNLDEGLQSELNRRVQLGMYSPIKPRDLIPDDFEFDAFRVSKVWLHQPPSLTPHPA
jgi:hypothetical protein